MSTAGGTTIRRKPLGRRVIEHRYVYILVLPAVAWMILFNYVPMFGLSIAFNEYDVFSGLRGFFVGPWVGFRNFVDAFSDEFFWDAFTNTFILSGLKILVGYPLPIVLALLLNEVRSRRYKKFVQTATFIPYLVSWAFVASFLYTLLSPSSGALNKILLSLRLVREPVFFMGNPEIYRWVVVFSSIWKTIGWSTVIYISSMATIDPGLYEAATIDGASRFQRVIHVTLPGIAPTMVMLLILNISYIVGAGITGGSFEQMFLLNNTLVLEVGEILDTYVYRIGLGLGRYSYATAVGLARSVLAVVLLTVSNQLSKKLVGHSIF